MSLKKLYKNHSVKSLLVSTLTLVTYFTVTINAHAQAGVFEVIHPDVSKGEVEIESLSGISLDSVEDGEENFATEFAVGYGITDYWKLTAAIEGVNIEGDDFEIEGFELESIVLLRKASHGHDHDHDHGHKENKSFLEGFFDVTVGLFTAVEIPEEGGLDEGALEIGPVFEGTFGPLDWVSNALLEIPFDSDEDPGLVFASQIIYPIDRHWGVGVESFAEFEGVFDGGDEEQLLAGPSLYYSAELGNGNVIEPRVAALFGLNDESADAVLSINIEYKFGG